MSASANRCHTGFFNDARLLCVSPSGNFAIGYSLRPESFHFMDLTTGKQTAMTTKRRPESKQLSVCDVSLLHFTRADCYIVTAIQRKKEWYLISYLIEGNRNANAMNEKLWCKLTGIKADGNNNRCSLLNDERGQKYCIVERKDIKSGAITIDVVRFNVDENGSITTQICLYDWHLTDQLIFHSFINSGRFNYVTDQNILKTLDLITKVTIQIDLKADLNRLFVLSFAVWTNYRNFCFCYSYANEHIVYINYLQEKPCWKFLRINWHKTTCRIYSRNARLHFAAESGQLVLSGNCGNEKCSSATKSHVYLIDAKFVLPTLLKNDNEKAGTLSATQDQHSGASNTAGIAASFEKMSLVSDYEYFRF